MFIDFHFPFEASYIKYCGYGMQKSLKVEHSDTWFEHQALGNFTLKIVFFFVGLT
jgi:hypothetical protein